MITKLLLFILVLLEIIIMPVYATEYYVKNGGDDTADGLSDATAWATISKVNSMNFQAGDIIYFNKGDSWDEELNIPSSGDINNKIRFTSYGIGDRPIISGIYAEDKQFFDIDGLESRTSLITNRRALTLFGCNNVTVNDCMFDGMQINSDDENIKQVVRIEKSSTQWAYNITISNCIVKNGGAMITYPQYGGGLCINKGAHDIIIENNTIYNHVEVDTQAYSSDDNYPVYNITWRGNTIYNDVTYNGGENIRGINIGFEAYNCLIENNYIYDCPQFLVSTDANTHDNIIKNNILVNDNISTVQGMLLILAGSYGDNFRTYVYNNTLINLTGTNYGIFISTSNEAISEGHIIKNNIIYSNQTDFRLIKNTAGDSFISDNNCLYNSGSGNIFEYNGVSYTSLSDWQSATGQDQNSIAADPLLDSDYVPMEGSPVIDAGAMLEEVCGTKDYRGLWRSRDDGLEIGAIEYFHLPVQRGE